MPKNYVIVFNDRPESEAALQWATKTCTQLAGAPGEVSLHIVLTGSGDSPASPNYPSPALARRVAADLSAAGVKFELHPSEVDLSEQVITLAETSEAELVVLGLRPRSATMKLLLGSYTQRILLDAPCPVVTVKAPR